MVWLAILPLLSLTGFLGHCYLMMDNLQEAYTAYQQALYHLQNPRVSQANHLSPFNADGLLQKEPKLWYGIGILYDRYGSLEHAEEAFSQVMTMEPRFEKANEIYFRLGIIYKQQQKFNQSLDVRHWSCLGSFAHLTLSSASSILSMTRLVR